MPASTILLIDADAPSAEAISTALTAVGYTVTTVADPGEAFGKVADHQLAIIDVVSGEKTAFDVCKEIRSTPALAQVPILCVGQSDDVEDRIRFLEAGADDVMAKPFDNRELEARVEALLLRFQRSKDLTAVVSTDGIVVTRQRRTVAVHSPRGGVGTTTVATNVAMVKAREKPDRVVLVDLHLQFGQVATLLNVEAKQSLADVARDDAAMTRAGAAPDLRGAARLRSPRPRRANVAGAGRADHGGARGQDPHDAPRVVRPRRDRRRVVARRADDDRVRARRVGAVHGHARDRVAQGDGRPARVPERGRLGRREVVVRAEQPVRAARS